MHGKSVFERQRPTDTDFLIRTDKNINKIETNRNEKILAKHK